MELYELTPKQALALAILEEGPRTAESLCQEMGRRCQIMTTRAKNELDRFVFNLLSRRLVVWGGSDNSFLVLAPKGYDQLRYCRELFKVKGES